ncbi:hypothetical protein K438DRAFT_1040328 [Mycena galopus ATCC 62051]|nr:hypothetical protein K438DRAFT_1040328 [Mycena galopus ATCC 62051]
MHNYRLTEDRGKGWRFSPPETPRRKSGLKVGQYFFIASGPGYCLHAGQSKGRPIIVKVFDSGPAVVEHLESTVAFCRGLFHPNVLRVEGISPSASPVHFITYENVHWKNAEGPLALALKDDCTSRSITLGFRMVAGLSAGLNYLNTQGISLASLTHKPAIFRRGCG